MSSTPHKHAEVLRAIADGKTVQWQSRADGGWNDRKGVINPMCDSHLNWRVKPEPKPDVVRYVVVHNHVGWPTLAVAKQACGDAFFAGYAQVTIDGETGKLKSVEIVE